MNSIGKFEKNKNYKVSLEDMEEFANNLSKILHTGMMVTLEGNLGTGKTTLSQKLIRNLLQRSEIDVTSPTFNIVQIYENNKVKIFHYDLYRIKSKLELVEIGIQDALNTGICIIEWPFLAEEFINSAHMIIRITLEHMDDKTRIFTWK